VGLWLYITESIEHLKYCLTNVSLRFHREVLNVAADAISDTDIVLGCFTKELEDALVK
jgi:hypothetical protein